MLSNVVFYGFVGQTHREPTRNDMLGGADDIDPVNYDQVSNFKRVSPEKVVNYELGCKLRTTKLLLDINYFNMQFTNEIAAIGQLSYIGLPLRKNIARSSRQGIELDVRYTTNKKLSIWGNATYMVSSIKHYTSDYDTLTYNNVKPLLAPNIITNIGVDYTLKSITFSTDMKYISSSQLDNTNNKQLVLPEYYVLNMGCSINLPHNTSLVINVNNVLDTKYYTSGYAQNSVAYYYVASVRNMFITFNKKF